MSLLGRIVRVVSAAVYLIVCFAVAGMAVMGALGFIYPAMDLFNHLQPALFPALVALVVLTPVFVRPVVARALALSIAATGLVASSIVYIPEVVSGFTAAPAAATDEHTTYTLMTFNVFGRNTELGAVVDSINAVDPDIVALQEYHPNVRAGVHPLLAGQYPHFQYCAGGERAFVGLYSKLPFEPLEEDACSSSIMTPTRTARIIVAFDVSGGPEFSLATTHQDWPAPVTRQAEQYALLREALSTVEPPLILVGDFNSTPFSYALRNFVEAAGLERHTRNMATFPTRWPLFGQWWSTPAFLPIDHVMTRGGITIHDLRTGDAASSDHKPIIVTFSVAEAE